VDKTRSFGQISIDHDSGIPLWLQLRNRIIYLIESGHFEVGDKLPTIRKLAVELGINFNTVSRVYRDVERDGYIISRQGAGTFVFDGWRELNGAALEETELLVDDFIRQCKEMGIPSKDIVGLVKKRLDVLNEK
jgi:GntR family transcriptional regulator